MIYVDMDGVVADFDQAVERHYGRPYDNKLADDFWKRTCVEAELFRKSEPIAEGLEMVKALREMGHQLCFMTSTGGMPHHIDIAKQKLDWLHAHGLGDLPVAFCMNTDGPDGKGAFAKPGAILIDDREKVCTAWNRGHGIALLFERSRWHEIVDQLRPPFC